MLPILQLPCAFSDTVPFNVSMFSYADTCLELNVGLQLTRAVSGRLPMNLASEPSARILMLQSIPNQLRYRVNGNPAADQRL
jgi:hypothetical protein